MKARKGKEGGRVGVREPVKKFLLLYSTFFSSL